MEREKERQQSTCKDEVESVHARSKKKRESEKEESVRRSAEIEGDRSQLIGRIHSSNREKREKERSD